MTTCPLPIDWLDLLEGRPSVAARGHLDGCASCRAVVAALTDRLPDSLPLPQLVSDTIAQVPSLLEGVADPMIVEGQLRWLAVEGADVRLPVLVLGLAHEDTEADFDDTTATDGMSMPSCVDIAPLWTDRENATSADLLLGESETTTGVAWRVAFRRQTTVPADLLTELFGSLTTTGEAAVARAIAGQLPPDKTGPELESEFDPRLTADEWMIDVLDRAFERVDEPGDPLAIGVFYPAKPDRGADLLWTDVSAVTFAFELKRVPEPETTQHALAAAPTGYRRSVLWAHLRDAAGRILDASIRWDRHNDRLLLHPQVVEGFNHVVVIVVRSPQLTEPLKVTAEMRPDTDVILSEGAGISDRDIESLELQLS
jgi:hypothetical protein